MYRRLQGGAPTARKPDSTLRDVWISQRVRRTPAHRRVEGNPTPDDRNLLTACGWRPQGGLLISREAAASLEAMPCRACFQPSNPGHHQHR